MFNFHTFHFRVISVSNKHLFDTETNLTCPYFFLPNQTDAGISAQPSDPNRNNQVDDSNKKDTCKGATVASNTTTVRNPDVTLGTNMTPTSPKANTPSMRNDLISDSQDDSVDKTPLIQNEITKRKKPFL